MAMNTASSLFTNLTNITKREPPPIPAIWMNSWTSTYLLICIEGATGNALLVFLILYNNRFRSGCGILIAHCLIAYTILCGLNFPIVTISAYVKQLTSWHINPKHCKYPQFIQMTCRMAAIWLDAFIAINRLLALNFPYRYREIAKKKLEYIVLIFCWTLPGTMCFFGFFDIGMVYVMLFSLGTCAALPRGKLGVLVTFVGFYIPAAAAGVIYLVIYISAAKRKRTKIAVPATSKFDSKSGEISSEFEKKRMMTTNMMCGSYLLNSAFTQVMPIAIHMFMSAENDLTQPLPIMWMAVVQLLGYGINPPVCFIINKDYREEVRRMTKKIASRLRYGKFSAHRIGSADVEMASGRSSQPKSL